METNPSYSVTYWGAVSQLATLSCAMLALFI